MHIQVSAGRGHSLSWWQRAALLANPFTFSQKSRTGRSVNRSIHSTAAQKGRVSSIHDCIRGLIGDVAHHQLKSGFGSDSISHAVRHFICW
jgi:hypothetical protein